MVKFYIACFVSVATILGGNPLLRVARIFGAEPQVDARPIDRIDYLKRAMQYHDAYWPWSVHEEWLYHEMEQSPEMIHLPDSALRKIMGSRMRDVRLDAVRGVAALATQMPEAQKRITAYEAPLHQALRESNILRDQEPAVLRQWLESYWRAQSRKLPPPTGPLPR